MTLLDFGKLGLTTGVGLLLGVAAATYVQPHTNAGRVFLVLIVIVACNVVVQIYAGIRRALRKRGGFPT